MKYLYLRLLIHVVLFWGAASMVFGKTPSLFLGVFDAQHGRSPASKYLSQGCVAHEPAWRLTCQARDFFTQNPEWEKKLNLKVKEQYANTQQRDMDRSLRLGFFRINSTLHYQNFSIGTRRAWVTVKLTWIEVGQANRAQDIKYLGDTVVEEKTLEVLNSHTELATGYTDLSNSRENMRRLEGAFKNTMNLAMRELVQQMSASSIRAKQKKPIYMMVDWLRVGKKASDLMQAYLNEVNKEGAELNNEIFVQDLKIRIRNSLARSLRANHEVDELVLIPSKDEALELVGDWREYMQRYKDITNPDAVLPPAATQKVVTPLSDSRLCGGRGDDERFIEVPGYWIQSMLSKFYKEQVLSDSEDNGFLVHGTGVSQIVFPKKSKDQIPAPHPAKEQKEQRAVGVAVRSFVNPKLSHVGERLDVYDIVLDAVVDDMIKELSPLVVETVKKHDENYPSYKRLCGPL